MLKLLNIRQICKCPGTSGSLLPFGRGKFYELVADGELPQPTKIGRNSFWLEADILAFLAGFRESHIARMR